MIHPSVSRYLPLVENADRFLSSLTRSLPVCIWANPMKTTPARLEQVLRELAEYQPLTWEAISWYPGAYRIYGWTKPGRTMAFIAGWYTIQEEIALAAVRALDPQPGDRVLDLCASPGGKTAQLSFAVGFDGMVMANERSIGRLAALSTTVTRLGLTNVMTSGCDGRFLAVPFQSFDRILVDVPCSGEGTIRKKAGRQSLESENWKPSHSQRLVRIQRQLLDRALRLVKPGGVVVYSTCTFAPEENEAVVDAVVGDRGVIEPYTIAGLDHAPGVLEWNGQSFRGDCRHAHRYWPDWNNTGGFFVARIRRTDKDLISDASLLGGGEETATLSQDGNSQMSLKSVDDQQSMLWMRDRFGIDPHHLNKYRYWSTGREKEWVASPACIPFANIPINTIGIPFVRHASHGFKPTTAALQWLGPFVNQTCIDLSWKQGHQFVTGSSQPFGNRIQSLKSPNPQGFVHVRSGPYELGCGRWKDQQLYCELPKSLRLQ